MNSLWMLVGAQKPPSEMFNVNFGDILLLLSHMLHP